jgi:MFS family permease
MSLQNIQTRALWIKTRSAFIRLATGGDWALSQSEGTRRNLIWFWFDGFFASAGDNIVGTYLVVFLLAMGATQTQIGLMSSLSSLTAALLLLPGAMLVERIGKRRNLVLIGGGWARLAILFIALLPLFRLAPAMMIPVAIAISVSRDAIANLSFPAWMSLTGDIIPIEGRGRYFSSRNFIMGLSGMVMTFVAGLIITRFIQPVGYQVALIAAFVIGLLSIYSFAHISDRPIKRPQPVAIPQSKRPGQGFSALLKDLTSQREFLYFTGTSALWNFSINIAGPFFNVYLVKNLHADATMVGLTSIASSIATMLAQRKLGDLNDRWGARRLTMISGLLIPIVPLGWLFASSGWHVILINLIGGVLWAGYNLASFNYLLFITPEDNRARFSALFQVIITVSLALGPMLGSQMVAHLGYNSIFIASGAGRMIAALLLVRLLTLKRPATQAAAVLE